MGQTTVTGKVLTETWYKERWEALHDLGKLALSAEKKLWLELTDDQIGMYDPENFMIDVVTLEGNIKRIDCRTDPNIG